jgi:hypothetical protein
MGLRAGLGREVADFGFLNRSTRRGPIGGIFKRVIGRAFVLSGWNRLLQPQIGNGEKGAEAEARGGLELSPFIPDSEVERVPHCQLLRFLCFLL